MQKNIIFDGKTIGLQRPCFIIAEAGVNHNGRLDLAFGLVDAAAKAGADAVKFQTFKAEQVVTAQGEMAAYQRRNLRVKESQRDMLRKLELPETFYSPLIKRCREKGIIFLSTPHGGKSSVDFLESLGILAYKIGSGDLTNYLLLEKIAKIKKPIFLSTGMATLEEVQDTVQFIKSQGNDKIVILHCTTNYPCPPEEVNMAAMGTMIRDVDALVGYSDHTEGLMAAKLAAALGARVYECHFTLDKTLPGPDHAGSASLEDLKSRILAIHQIKNGRKEQALKNLLKHNIGKVMWGSLEKKPTQSEKDSMQDTIRKSIVFAKNMKKGEVIKRNDLTVKRPGNGISPTKYKEFIGAVLRREVIADKQLQNSDINKR
jgi:sialic acid synthase SpsE